VPSMRNSAKQEIRALSNQVQTMQLQQASFQSEMKRMGKCIGNLTTAVEGADELYAVLVNAGCVF
jgi:prefoldin subunit 5